MANTKQAERVNDRSTMIKDQAEKLWCKVCVFKHSIKHSYKSPTLSYLFFSFFLFQSYLLRNLLNFCSQSFAFNYNAKIQQKNSKFYLSCCLFEFFRHCRYFIIYFYHCFITSSSFLYYNLLLILYKHFLFFFSLFICCFVFFFSL